MALTLFGLIQFLSFALFTFAAPGGLETRGGKAAAAKGPVKFTIDLTWGDLAPIGGTPRKAILTNGAVPGPALHLNLGDDVEFTVNNNLPNETAIHFHGITQLNTPWSDGVPGLSQKAIQPGATYVYRWKADEAGVYFYHAHLRGQIQDGLYGAIVIADCDTSSKPFHLISNDTDARAAMRRADSKLTPIFISDWNQFTSTEVHQIERDGNIDFACADAILINGMVCLPQSYSPDCPTNDECRDPRSACLARRSRSIWRRNYPDSWPP